MDEPQKKKSFDAAIAAIEKSIDELNQKFNRISEQLKNIHPDVGATTKQAEKKPGVQLQGKPQQDVIYVKKSTEFSFYS